MSSAVDPLVSLTQAREFLDNAFTLHNGRLRAHQSYEVARDVVAACTKFRIKECGGLTLGELKEQVAYLGRLNYTLLRRYSAESQQADEIMPGTDSGHSKTLVTSALTLSLVSASGHRRLRAELCVADSPGSGRLGDGGFRVAFTGTVLSAQVFWEAWIENARKPTKSHWAEQAHPHCGQWEGMLKASFARGKVTAVKTDLQRVWIEIIGNRPSARPLTSAALRMRWRLHDRMTVKVFCKDRTVVGVWNGNRTNTGGEMLAVIVDRQQIDAADVYNLLPVPPHS
ncbi:MAG TPA: hypothetical protein VLG40_00375 [Candidatus Saccharimonas sp.]|nr:hypothetical protein [Candidatus Saccharimonas sp.]